MQRTSIGQASLRLSLRRFDYPMHTLKVQSGSKNVTVAPGAQTGLFSTVGRLDPHTYRPNEFFANNWVYEGLVAYGANGVIEPALATSWTVANTVGGGQEYTFTLRQGTPRHTPPHIRASHGAVLNRTTYDNTIVSVSTLCYAAALLQVSSSMMARAGTVPLQSSTLTMCSHRRSRPATGTGGMTSPSKPRVGSVREHTPSCWRPRGPTTPSFRSSATSVRCVCCRQRCL